MSLADAPLTMPAKQFQSDEKAHKSNLKAIEDFVQILYPQLVPVGSIFPFGGVYTPNGWLLCDGSAVSRSTYSTLFGVIGTLYGAGDGTTTFNVPSRAQVIALLTNTNAGATPGIGNFIIKS